MEQVIQICGLKKSFNGHQVLSDINLTVNRGENVVVPASPVSVLRSASRKAE